MRVSTSIAAALAALTLGTLATMAPPTPWRLVRAGDGSLQVIADSVRHRIAPAPMGDAELASVREAEAWGSGAMAPGTTTAPAPVAQSAARREGPITLNGSGIQKTRPFALRGANYSIRWTATPKSAMGC